MALELESPVQEVIAPEAPDRVKPKSLPFARNRVAGRDRMFFTEQLALLLETGTSLHEALDALKNRLPTRPWRKSSTGCWRTWRAVSPSPRRCASTRKSSQAAM